ncbi:MAG TPA: Flp family type IVb pilin [Reyranella sp.]|jgi:pilus assembly protein Flp/PilA|nr:Flp family type IVb pilin [Reyranella sp.]
MSGIFSRFIRDDSGATAIEYGLIAGLIAVVVVTAITTIGTKLTNTFNNIANQLK